jgi:hypothetical protein
MNPYQRLWDFFIYCGATRIPGQDGIILRHEFQWGQWIGLWYNIPPKSRLRSLWNELWPTEHVNELWICATKVKGPWRRDHVAIRSHLNCDISSRCALISSALDFLRSNLTVISHGAWMSDECVSYKGIKYVPKTLNTGYSWSLATDPELAALLLAARTCNAQATFLLSAELRS